MGPFVSRKLRAPLKTSIPIHSSNSSLVAVATKHNSRVVQITSRCPTFSFHPRFTAREKIPLKFHVLSDTVYTIQLERPFENGAYPVIFGQSALSGFEFQIASSGAYRD
jgi:hypothetical protein